MNVTYDSDGTAVIEISKGKDDEWEPAEDGFSVDELKGLWLQFADAPDAAERLSGFAECGLPAAKELIRRFQGESSCARRATEADAQRKLVNDTTSPEKPTESPEKPTQAKRKGRQKKIEELEIDDSQLEHIAPDALLAALVNNKYDFSEILAEGRNSKRSVVVERFSGVYRLKRTSYQFFCDFDSALQAARKEGLKLQTFGS